MSSAYAFQPGAPNVTVNLAVGVGSTNVAAKNGPTSTLRLLNSGANVVFVEIHTAAQTASLTTSMPMLPNSVETFNAPQNAIVSAIAGATGNTLYITPGDGL